MFAAPSNMALLQAAEQALPSAAVGGVLPSSCRNGACRTCMCQLLEGEVVYRIAWPGLSADEKRSGLILPCVAYPVSDVVLGAMAAS